MDKYIDRAEMLACGVEQRAGESDKAFEAFLQFLSLYPVGRSVEKLSGCGQTRAQVSEWKCKHDWNARAVNYDKISGERGLARLVGSRHRIAVEALRASVEDASILRDELMLRLARCKRPTVAELATLISARIQIDVWRGQLFECLNAMDNTDATATHTREDAA